MAINDLMKIDSTDEEFVSSLREYLSQFSEGHKPIVPLMKSENGLIDREKTLALPCYENYKGIA